MIDLVLQAPGQHPGPLDRDRLAVQVDPGGDRVPGPRGGQVEAGYRQAALQVVLVAIARLPAGG